jgi:poly(hydroxyalkanoate) depolymerase family esterase
MNFDFKRLMQDATRFTAHGDLQAATAAIQAALQGIPAGPGPATGSPPSLEGLVIDVEAREAPLAGRPDRMPDDAPTGTGQFIAGRWGAAGSSREYKLYIPPQAGQGPLPLVLMLHGCTQDPDDFAAGTRMNELARAQGCFVLYPAQSQKANPQRCWNWFKHTHQARGRGEPALLAGMTRDVMARYPVDPARVYVAGLSAGGAMAAILADAYPELYAAAGVHSGLAAGSARDLPSALGAMRSGTAGQPLGAGGHPVIVFHGDADTTVHPGNGGHVIASSIGPTPAAGGQRQRCQGGRDYTVAVHRGADGEVLAEHWVVHGSPHAWSGGSGSGSYTDPQGPDASREMLRFFLEHARR